MTGRDRGNCQRWRVTAAPALIVTVPLIGFAFRADERRDVYRAAVQFSANPVSSIRDGFLTPGSISDYLSRGNFRPVGRFAESLVHAFSFEAAEATRLSPNAILGAWRLLMIAMLAQVAIRVVAALMRSAGGGSTPPALAFYPLALGAVLVANGRSGPLVMNSALFIGTVGLVLMSSLIVARDSDMRSRPLRWHEPVGMALLGAVAASTYDLAYVAPLVVACFIAARAIAAGLPVSEVLRLAALRRWIALSVGFLAVFVPTRTEIASRCGGDRCYTSSDLSLSGDVLELVPIRMLSGTPAAGWLLNNELVQTYGPEFGLVDLAANALLLLLLLGVAAVTVSAAIAVAARSNAVSAGSAANGRDARGATREDAPDPIGSRATLRLVAALSLFGMAVAALSSLVVSLSKWIQSSRIDYGWRDTLLTQVGWSFVIMAAVVAAIGFLRAPSALRTAAAVAAAVLGTALTLTLLANARLTQIDRQEPVASMTNLIAALTINLDATEGGNGYRCALLESYAEVQTQFGQWHEEGLREDLDELMINRYGFPFCDPGRTAVDGP